MSTFTCPRCRFQGAVEIPLPKSRIKIICPRCSNILAIVVMPPWVKLEISWLLENGGLSEANEKFLRRISLKKFSELSDKQLARLSRLQGGGGES